MSDQSWNYMLILLGAVAGVLARVGRWRRDDGTFDGLKAAAEIMTIPAIAFIVSGGVAYFAPDMDVKAVTAISTLVGLAGVGVAEQLALKYFNKKLGD